MRTSITFLSAAFLLGLAACRKPAPDRSSAPAGDSSATAPSVTPADSAAEGRVELTEPEGYENEEDFDEPSEDDASNRDDPPAEFVPSMDSSALIAALGKGWPDAGKGFDLVEFFRAAFGSGMDPMDPLRFQVGDFNGDGNADLALHACVRTDYRPPARLRIGNPQADEFRREGDDRPYPDTGRAALFPPGGESFAGTAILHGPFSPDRAPGAGGMHLVRTGLPDGLIRWGSDSAVANPRKLKGHSIFTSGEGDGDGYLYWSEGRYKWRWDGVQEGGE